MFDFSNYSTKSKYCDNWNKLVIDKIKNETAGVDTEEFVGLKPKIYSYLVDVNSWHKEAKSVNKNVVGLDQMLLAMNRIQSKDHKIGTYGINKISLFFFDDTICTPNNGYDGLSLSYQSLL